MKLRFDEIEIDFEALTRDQAARIAAVFAQLSGLLIASNNAFIDRFGKLDRPDQVGALIDQWGRMNNSTAGEAMRHVAAILGKPGPGPAH